MLTSLSYPHPTVYEVELEGSSKANVAPLLLATCASACRKKGLHLHDVSIMVLFLKHD